MNLYQYLSPRSNHPPGMIKGIIYSLLKTYKNQNTHTEDYLDVVILKTIQLPRSKRLGQDRAEAHDPGEQ